jgi:hypothetical protein
MKVRHALSATLIAVLLLPVAAFAQQRVQEPGPAVKAIRQAVAQRPAVRRQLGKLSVEQKQQLRADVRALLQQSRQNLQSGQHTRGQRLKARMKLRSEIRKTLRKYLRGGGF